MPPVFFHEEGSGRPLVFLHGFCETHEIWKDFVRPLSDRFRIIMPDLPGFGKSEILPAIFTVDDVGDALASWLKDHHIVDSLLIGHSLGGYVTLSIAERHPQLLAGFGLFHSTAFGDTIEKKENRNKAIAFVRKHGVQPFINTFVPGLFFDKSSQAIPLVHKIACQTKVETLIGYSTAMRDRPDRTSVLIKSKTPKLLIAGSEDALVPIKASRKMAKMSQNCSFLELADVGHMGFFEAKEQCQLITTQFAEQVFSNN